MESMPTEIELKGTGWKKPDNDNHTKTEGQGDTSPMWQRKAPGGETVGRLY